MSQCMEVASLNGKVREDHIEMMAFEQRLEEGEGVRHGSIWEEECPR